MNSSAPQGVWRCRWDELHCSEPRPPGGLQDSRPRPPVSVIQGECIARSITSVVQIVTSSSPTSWQLSRAHLFCSFIKELRTPPAYSCGEGRGNETSGSFSAMPWLPFWIFSVVLTEMRGKHCGWKHLRSFFYPPQSLFSCNVVILYGNKLWLTYSKDISLKTFRVLICSKRHRLPFLKHKSSGKKGFPTGFVLQTNLLALTVLNAFQVQFPS